MDRYDVKFVDNIKLNCKFYRVGSQILVDSKVVTSRMITCARCLNQVKKTETQEFTLNYNVADLEDCLEVNNDIREEILLNFPMRVLCKDNCKGLCSGCGANLNTEQCSCQTEPI
jgi:uncharacterized protein